MVVRALVRSAVAAAIAGCCASVFAAPVLLTFEGVNDGAQVASFYNGGGGGNLGVTFGSSAQALVSSSVGGSGNFANAPSPDTALFFLGENAVVMNVAGGFTTGFSFYYSSLVGGSVTVWSGAGASGTSLATIALSAQADNGCDTAAFCNWTPFGGAFAGTALSVSFAGAANSTLFDNVTLGAVVPIPGDGGGTNPGEVPEPGSLALAGAALLGLAAVRRRRG